MLEKIKDHSKNLKSIYELEGEEGQFEYLIEIGKMSGY